MTDYEPRRACPECVTGQHVAMIAGYKPKRATK